MKNNRKILITCISVLALLIALSIMCYIINKPLDAHYKSEKFGNFDVRTERPNNHTVNLVFESTYIPESWRIKCLYEARYILPKDLVQAKLVAGDRTMPLQTTIAEHERIKLSLSITEDNINMFEFFSIKQTFKKILKIYDLELCRVFLDENNQDFPEIFNACKAVL